MNLALPFTVVLAMAGIYGGLVDDAIILIRSMHTDLWVVQAFPHFPRRVVLTPLAIGGVGAIVLVVCTLASILGVMHAMQADPGRAMEA